MLLTSLRRGNIFAIAIDHTHSGVVWHICRYDKLAHVSSGPRRSIAYFEPETFFTPGPTRSKYPKAQKIRDSNFPQLEIYREITSMETVRVGDDGKMDYEITNPENRVAFVIFVRSIFGLDNHKEITQFTRVHRYDRVMAANDMRYVDDIDEKGDIPISMKAIYEVMGTMKGSDIDVVQDDTLKSDIIRYINKIV